MTKSRRKSPAKGRPVMNPQGVALSKISVQNIDAHLKIQKYPQRIVHNGATRGHIAVLGTGAQQYMVGMRGWYTIK